MSEQLVKVWPREVIVEAVTEAVGIIAELSPPEDLRLEAFKAALQMSCQRRPAQSAVAVPGLAPSIRNGRRN